MKCMDVSSTPLYVQFLTGPDADHTSGLLCIGSSSKKGAKLGEESSVRADWLCIGWPFCQAELRREFQTGGQFFCTRLYCRTSKKVDVNFPI